MILLYSAAPQLLILSLHDLFLYKNFCHQQGYMEYFKESVPPVYSVVRIMYIS